MAEDKKSVILYCDIIFTVEELKDDEAGRLFKHYLRYINDLNPECPDRLTQLLFEPIKQNLKRDLKKWECKSEKNSKIAKEGWVKRKHANASERKKQYAINADNVNVNINDIVTDNVNEINKNIPALSEFLDYVKSNSENFELIKNSAELKYKSWVENKWHDGNDKKIKNWKSKILNTISFLGKEKSSEKKENKMDGYKETYANLGIV